MIEQKTEQLTLDLGNKHSFNVDDFITLPSNQGLVNQLLNTELGTSPLTILFGAQQSGKTHLAHLWANAFNAEFLPPGFLQIDEVDFPKLAEKINTTAIIIDDVDQKQICEKTIFHIINIAISSKQKLLFTSNKPLPLWDINLPDLLSRLKAAKHLEVTQPDDLLIEAILYKCFAEKQLNVAENVVAYILPRLERSIEAVVKLVDQLDKYALAEKKPITRMMVAKMYENGLI